MAYLEQPWFNREIVNRFAMATLGEGGITAITVFLEPALFPVFGMPTSR